MTWTIRYYSDAVQRGVLSLPKDILADYLRLADLLTEFGADLRMPHSRAMGGGLFELRPRGREGIARVFYCMQIGRTIVVLHSFIKKTGATPRREMDTALRRMKEMQRAYPR
jgi:phage-related protein